MGRGIRQRMPRWKLLKAREMRAHPTPSERCLWEALRREQLGLRFRRQSPMFGFIADFYAPEVALIVEVDGPIHDPEADRQRDAILRRHGLSVLRFKNEEVLSGLPQVTARIQAFIEARRSRDLRRTAHRQRKILQLGT